MYTVCAKGSGLPTRSNALARALMYLEGLSCTWRGSCVLVASPSRNFKFGP